MVDGEEVVLTTQEESDLRAEWAVNDFAASKENKKIEMQTAFQSAENATVDYLGVTYSGGRSSARSIKESLDLSELAVATTVDVYDANSDPVQLTIAETQGLVLTIAIVAKTNIFNLNAKLKLAEAAANQTELDAITW